MTLLERVLELYARPNHPLLVAETGNALADVLFGAHNPIHELPNWLSGDAAGDLLYVNRRWIEYTGLTSAQTDRRGYMRTIHPADLPRFLDHAAHVLPERDKGVRVADILSCSGI